MNLEIHFREMESTEAIKKHIETRAQKLQKFIDDKEHVRVIVGAKAKGKRHFAEIYWHDNNEAEDIVLKKEGDNLYTQIDELFEATILKFQKIHSKHKDRQQKKTALKKAVRD